MSASYEPSNGADGDAPKLGPLERVRRAIFFNSGERKISRRLSQAFLKPPKPGTEIVETAPPTAEELAASEKTATDKERLFGLIAAPWAAGIGIVIGAALISHDPAVKLSNGQPNKLHVAISLYQEAMGALVVLSILMLVFSLRRKRMYLGIVMALYGLTVFNLHYWGFGVPFIMCGAWLLMRAYRIHQNWREVSGEGPTRGRTTFKASARPNPNKRYTPPTSRSRL